MEIGPPPSTSCWLHNMQGTWFMSFSPSEMITGFLKNSHTVSLLSCSHISQHICRLIFTTCVNLTRYQRRLGTMLHTWFCTGLDPIRNPRDLIRFGIHECSLHVLDFYLNSLVPMSIWQGQTKGRLEACSVITQCRWLKAAMKETSTLFPRLWPDCFTYCSVLQKERVFSPRYWAFPCSQLCYKKWSYSLRMTKITCRCLMASCVSMGHSHQLPESQMTTEMPSWSRCVSYTYTPNAMKFGSDACISQSQRSLDSCQLFIFREKNSVIA